MGHAKPRRIVLIAPRFQLRLAGEFVLLQILLTALFAGGLYLFMSSEIQANLESAHASYRTLGQMLMPIVGTLSAFSIVLSTVLVTLYVVHLSHRIARPLLRIRAVLEELALRRFLDHTGIQPGDQLSEVDRSLTAAVTTIRTDLQELRQAARALRQAHEAGQGAAVLQQLEALERTLDAWVHTPKATD